MISIGNVISSTYNKPDAANYTLVLPKLEMYRYYSTSVRTMESEVVLYEFHWNLIKNVYK